jgi:hypothetical protein
MPATWQKRFAQAATIAAAAVMAFFQCCRPGNASEKKKSRDVTGIPRACTWCGGCFFLHVVQFAHILRLKQCVTAQEEAQQRSVGALF